MATSEERLKILTLIQEGKVTAEEGMRLLETVEAAQQTRSELINSIKASRQEMRESARKLKEEVNLSKADQAKTKDEIRAESKRMVKSIRDLNAEVRKQVAESATIRTPRWVNIHVTDMSTGKSRVDVRLPVGVVTAGIKMGARFAPEVEGLNSDVLMEMINTGQTGMVADICDEEDCEHIEVTLE